MEEIIDFEQRLNTNTDLLEIAKDYCEFNIDKEKSMGSLMSLLEILLCNQRKIISELDKSIIKEV